MHARAVDDHACLRVIGHLLQRQRRAQHVLRKFLAALHILGAHAHAVVHRKAAVAPGEHSRGQALGEHPLADEQLGRPGAKARFEQLRQNSGQPDERSVLPENAIGGKHMMCGLKLSRSPKV